MRTVIKIITKIRYKSAACIILSAYLLFCALAFPQRTAMSVTSALTLGIKTVVPSVFVFSVAMKMLSPYMCRVLSRFSLLQKALCVSPGGLCMIFSGMLSGFPVGAVVFSELYRGGYISREEGISLMPFCNNAGAAFLVGGVGIGMAKSANVGVILLVAQALSSMIMLVITAPSRRVMHRGEKAYGGSSSVVKSITQSGMSMISILSFMAFFSVISDAICADLHLFGYIEALLRGALEIGGGLAFLFSSALPGRIALSGAIVGFSGISVMMQVSFAAGVDIYRNYFQKKLLMSALCALISSALSRIISAATYLEILGSGAKNAYDTLKFFVMLAIFAAVSSIFAIFVRYIFGKYLK